MSFWHGVFTTRTWLCLWSVDHKQNPFPRILNDALSLFVLRTAAAVSCLELQPKIRRWWTGQEEKRMVSFFRSWAKHRSGGGMYWRHLLKLWRCHSGKKGFEASQERPWPSHRLPRTEDTQEPRNTEGSRKRARHAGDADGRDLSHVPGDAHNHNQQELSKLRFSNLLYIPCSSSTRIASGLKVSELHA